LIVFGRTATEKQNLFTQNSHKTNQLLEGKGKAEQKKKGIYNELTGQATIAKRPPQRAYL